MTDQFIKPSQVQSPHPSIFCCPQSLLLSTNPHRPTTTQSSKLNLNNFIAKNLYTRFETRKFVDKNGKNSKPKKRSSTSESQLSVPIGDVRRAVGRPRGRPSIIDGAPKISSAKIRRKKKKEEKNITKRKEKNKNYHKNNKGRHFFAQHISLACWLKNYES